mgnify:CR=1 FL=1
MKKLLLILLISLSLSSYGEWIQLPTNEKGGTYIDFDNLQLRTDGYVYWWMMVSDSSSSQTAYIQTDCKTKAVNVLQLDSYDEPMGAGDLTSTKPDEGWLYVAPDKGIYRFIRVVCELAEETPEEREKSIANLLMELEYKTKINTLSEEQVDISKN